LSALDSAQELREMASPDTNIGVEILRKRDALLLKRHRLQRLNAVITALMEEVDLELADCVAAGRAFGLSVPLPNWSNVLRTSLDEEMERVERIVGWGPWEKPLEEREKDQELLCQLFEKLDEWQFRPSRSAPIPSLRHIVVERLQAAGEEGTTAADIRAHARACVSVGFHQKTIGMTLNRLAKRGLARREGRVWHWVSGGSKTQDGPEWEAFIEARSGIRVGGSG
jgi:hypothetical protein